MLVVGVSHARDRMQEQPWPLDVETLVQHDAAMDRVVVKDPAEAGAILEAALKGLATSAELTVADAAARSGLSLGDAERGLHFLSTKFRGTLSATDQGQLLFRFPYGLSLPLTKKPWFVRAVDRVKSAVVGAGKFLVRAWVSVVMVGYALVFVAVGLALLFSGRDERGGGGALLHVVFRVLMEALYWTFHPFSPVAQRNVWDGSLYDARERRRTRTRTIRRFGELVTIEEPVDDDVREEVPFYEKVNRFVFGPEKAKPPTHEELSKRLVAQIRVNQGRIGLLDVMKVTGLPREEADPLLARLLLDYEGEVDVDEHGAITYRFEALRKTAGGQTSAPQPAWTTKTPAPRITGNAGGTNFMVAAVNAFNLIAATVALKMNLTVDRLFYLLEHARDALPAPPMPYDGPAIALGIVPWVFSVVLFALPIIRWVQIDGKKKAVDEENARSAVLKTVFQAMQESAGKGEAVQGVREDRLKRAWKEVTGKEPDDEQLTRAVVELGGDVDTEAMAAGRGLYVFRDLEAEVAALRAQRAAASNDEADAGRVVFRAQDEAEIAALEPAEVIPRR